MHLTFVLKRLLAYYWRKTGITIRVASVCQCKTLWQKISFKVTKLSRIITIWSSSDGREAQPGSVLRRCTLSLSRDGSRFDFHCAVHKSYVTSAMSEWLPAKIMPALCCIIVSNGPSERNDSSSSTGNGNVVHLHNFEKFAG